MKLSATEPMTVRESMREIQHPLMTVIESYNETEHVQMTPSGSLKETQSGRMIAALDYMKAHCLQMTSTHKLMEAEHCNHQKVNSLNKLL